VKAHRTIIEAGPGAIRRLCCGTGSVDEGETSEIASAALDGIDDQLALVGGRPESVDSLWRTALRSVTCAPADGTVVVHPSWWPSARISVVTAAAADVADGMLARPRSWLLTQATDAQRDTTVVVEIAERLVAITAAEVVAIPRCDGPRAVADDVARVIARNAAAAVVLIDAPSAVTGASAIATLIADAIRSSGRAVVEIDDGRLRRLARAAAAVPDTTARPTSSGSPRRSRKRAVTGLAGAAVVLAVAGPAMAASVTENRRGAPPPAPVRSVPTTFLVEGRVALTVPADWTAQRVVTGPGSARVQVTSPSDPEVALHITQSPVAGETLSGTAERLKHAIDLEAAGVFVDFNPAGISAGRPAVTYREVRAGHHVRWTVLLDGPVRISVGCQSRPADEGAVRGACEQAVRSAHAIG
jgi:type VII secretion-associated protein (TIGR03931 family)